MTLYRGMRLVHALRTDSMVTKVNSLGFHVAVFLFTQGRKRNSTSDFIKLLKQLNREKLMAKSKKVS